MKRLAAALSILLLTGAGCPMMPSNNTGAVEQDSFAVGTWTMMSVTESGKAAQDVSDINARLTLNANGHLSAMICNSITGDYSLKNDELKAPSLISTLKFCTGVPGDVETAFMQGISTGMEVSGAGNQLMLEADSGTRFTFARLDGALDQEDEDRADEDQQTVNGTITAIDLSTIPVDGPAKLKIRTTAGATADVHVPSFGLALCESKDIADVYKMKVGDRIEARGSVSPEGAIVPCSESSHYLRVQK